MGRFVEGADRSQLTLLPDRLSPSLPSERPFMSALKDGPEVCSRARDRRF
jgi:hypothetical protein